MYIYILLLYSIVYVNGTLVKNKDEFLDLVSRDKDTLEILIDSDITLDDNCNITHTINKLSITGSSEDKSILRFSNPLHQLFFGNGIKEIEIQNISIIGNLFFSNNHQIIINFVSLYGKLDTDFNNNDYNNLKISNLTYNPNTFTTTKYCINLNGNTEIIHSKFQGNSQCTDRIIRFNGSNKYKLNIDNVYLNGNFITSGLFIENGLNVNVNNSIFENIYSRKNENNEGGSSINIMNSYTKVTNSIFRNSYSQMGGGVFYLNNINDFLAENIEVYNSTAITSGSMAYITSDKQDSLAKFKNITQIHSEETRGIQYGAKVQIKNYYAENLVNMDGSGCAFEIKDNSSIEIL
ncbi:hypothetical protein PIROE2DRAFT_4742 [Piromyces sp. E2]|nr:hypothetical protein PIROE2DRAFT_4742 [Piromyces sp. E2]|eukprot:OUM67786.1 hypothetical protein PIROE2DRAFT_4742 [Piromyces sp. E2]